MTVGQISSAASTSTGTSTDQTALSQNYELFLSILTTQIRNQNPLEPMDANQFTQQLVQYSTVEQQIKTNDSMSTLISTLSTSVATSLVGYVGADITAEGSTTTLANGSATWKYNLPEAAGSAEITIRNTAGTVVHQETVKNLPEGDGTYAWDGKTSSGTTANDGVYQMTIKAKNSDGDTIKTTTTISGKVTSVDYTGTEVLLKIGDLGVPLASIKSVSKAN